MYNPDSLKTPVGRKSGAGVHFVHKITMETKWFPPPVETNEEIAPPVIDVDAQRSRDIRSHFAPRPSVESFTREITGEPEPEPVVEEPSPLEEEEPSIYDQVFTHDLPVFLRMDEKEGKERSLVHHAKRLGFYEDKDIRKVLEKKLEKYWIEKCGGYEEYTKATIFQSKKQDIARDRKQSGNKKRKAEFAEAQTEEKKTSKSKRKILSTKVSNIVVFVLSC